MDDTPKKAKNAAPDAPRRPARAELVLAGKYDAAGRRVAPLRVALPFQTVETVNESAQDRQSNLQFGPGFREEQWRNRLIGGDKKYVLPSLLPEFAGRVNLIYLAAGVERWKEYREQLTALGKKPVLFVMMNDTAEADDVGDWLRKKYPLEFGGERLLIIHTDRSGEVSKKDLDIARKASREGDDEKSPINCIVSVMMLREGWDVQGVTVIVGLRP